MLTSMIRILEFGLVPAISYFFGVKLLSNWRASMACIFRGKPEYGSISAAVLLHETVAVIILFNGLLSQFGNSPVSAIKCGLVDSLVNS